VPRPRNLLGRFQKGPPRKFQGKLLQSFFGDQHTIPVELVASGDIKKLIRDLEAMGIKVKASAGRTVSALIPREKLGALEKLGSLKFARPAVTSKTPFNPPTSAPPIRAFPPISVSKIPSKKRDRKGEIKLDPRERFPVGSRKGFPGEIQEFSGRPQISKAERLNIVKAALRLRLTPGGARDFTANTGRKLPTLKQAKKIIGRIQPAQRTSFGGGFKRRRGL